MISGMGINGPESAMADCYQHTTSDTCICPDCEWDAFSGMCNEPRGAQCDDTFARKQKKYRKINNSLLHTIICSWRFITVSMAKSTVEAFIKSKRMDSTAVVEIISLARVPSSLKRWSKDLPLVKIFLVIAR